MVEQVTKIAKLSMFREFRTFLLRGNVIDLAVGLIAGTAFGAVVKSLVGNVIMPIVTAVAGKPNYNNLSFAVHHSVVHYGTFITAVVTFVLTMAAIFYCIVKPINIMTQHLLPPTESGEPVKRECTECLAEVPAKARRCMFCTSELAPVVGDGA